MMEYLEFILLGVLQGITEFLPISSSGHLLLGRKLFNINDMNDINFVKDETEISYSKRSFVYDFLSSMRQKVNDPLGVRAKKRKKIKSQQ